MCTKVILVLFVSKEKIVDMVLLAVCGCLNSLFVGVFLDKQLFFRHILTDLLISQNSFIVGEIKGLSTETKSF